MGSGQEKHDSRETPTALEPLESGDGLLGTCCYEVVVCKRQSAVDAFRRVGDSTKIRFGFGPMPRQKLEGRHETVRGKVRRLQLQRGVELLFGVARTVRRPVEVSECQSRPWIFRGKTDGPDQGCFCLLSAPFCEFDQPQVGVSRTSIGVELDGLLDRLESVVK